MGSVVARVEDFEEPVVFDPVLATDRMVTQSFRHGPIRHGPADHLPVGKVGPNLAGIVVRQRSVVVEEGRPMLPRMKFQTAHGQQSHEEHVVRNHHVEGDVRRRRIQGFPLAHSLTSGPPTQPNPGLADEGGKNFHPACCRAAAAISRNSGGGFGCRSR